MMDIEQEMQNIFNKEIVRELLFEDDPNVDEATVQRIYERCGANPWDAQFFKKLEHLTSTMKVS